MFKRKKLDETFKFMKTIPFSEYCVICSGIGLSVFVTLLNFNVI
jgi:hypothetical protein